MRNIPYTGKLEWEQSTFVDWIKSSVQISEMVIEYEKYLKKIGVHNGRRFVSFNIKVYNNYFRLNNFMIDFKVWQLTKSCWKMYKNKITYIYMCLSNLRFYVFRIFISIKWLHFSHLFELFPMLQLFYSLCAMFFAKS